MLVLGRLLWKRQSLMFLGVLKCQSFNTGKRPNIYIFTIPQRQKNDPTKHVPTARCVLDLDLIPPKIDLGRVEAGNRALGLPKQAKKKSPKKDY